MGGLINSIIIQKSNFANDIPLEECEKKEGNCIVRFQRPARVSPLEHFIRFFSDMRDGVTKAADNLCDLDGNLPVIINVKGHRLTTGEDKFGRPEGKLTDADKDLPVGAEVVPIFFRAAPAEASQSASTTSDASDATTNNSKKAPPVPSTVGRPPLFNAQQPLTSKQAPLPPSRNGRPELDSTDQLLSLNAAEIVQLWQPHSLSPEDSPASLPAEDQRPVAAAAPPPAPPLGRPNISNNSSAMPSRPAQDLVRPALQEQNAAEKSSADQLLNEIRTGFKLRATVANAKREPTVEAKTDPTFNQALIDKQKSRRNAIEGNDAKGDSTEWDD